MSEPRYIASTAAAFPPQLASIYEPPPGLWTRGSADLGALFSRPAVAVVGARACSTYGAHVARQLGRNFAAAGAVVVSGGARGIDAEAIRGALDAGGPAAVVLGCGIDRDYPIAHRDLFERVTSGGGLILSEYAPGVEPAPWRFPARNRIVAGLVAAGVVVEARQHSGALITVDLAMEAGREVYAVPGEITSLLSEGTNRLLAYYGARPLIDARDVLDAIGATSPDHALVP